MDERFLDLIEKLRNHMIHRISDIAKQVNELVEQGRYDKARKIWNKETKLFLKEVKILLKEGEKF